MEEPVPDAAEESLAELIDNAIPTRGYGMLPVVGLGGSAGSIPALQQFFGNMPAQSGLAFVVVLHLSAEHESVLAELLQRVTTLTVVQVQDTVKIEADSVYVIPPGKVLRAMNGYLKLTDLPTVRRRHVTVDLFLRTLADTHGPHATAIILSGGDGDGAIGIKRIKERGGLTIAQDPDEAEHSGMPRAALATGMVDWTLLAADMPERVLAYHRLERQIQLPSEDGPALNEARKAQAVDESVLHEVLVFLRTRTSRDFSSYKRATVLRRIGRRMQVNAIGDLKDYLSFLRTQPGEAGALLQDLLISVTNFFRDAESFTALESHLPRIFQGKGPGDTVRIWVCGCATGEEAYSLAILVSEHMRTLEMAPVVQIFATDLNDDAIRIARDGIYPSAIEADVNEERIRRFFVKEHRGYRVRREIREMVLFAVHDVLKDSPFSRLDLISCRNLLIYVDGAAHGRVFDTFDFCLLPDGLVFLGTSESMEDSAQFSAVDKKHRIYSHLSSSRTSVPLPSSAGTLALALETQHAVRVGPVIANSAFARHGPHPSDRRLLPSSAGSWGELHFRLLEHFAPPSVLVNAEHDIVHVSPSAGRYLQFSAGVPSTSLLLSIHPALRLGLRGALFLAMQRGTAVELPVISMQLADRSTARVVLRVVPAIDLAPGYLLVHLNEVEGMPPESAATQGVSPALADDTISHHLDREMERLKLHLRDTVEQYEVSTEELKASNEELQAMNEELRSATEELETSREELQSINEELSTVNLELKSKVDELGSANSDMHNLINATAIATLFLDRNMRITRYTPAAVSLFNLIPSDIGRPLSDLTTLLDYPMLGSDAQGVLQSLEPVEREVGGLEGRWFLVRARPYRTLEDRIGGVVLTFVDISDRKRNQEALRLSEARFGAIVSQATVGVLQANLQGRITFVNPSFCRLLGYSDDVLRGMSLLDITHPDDRDNTSALFARLTEHGESFHIEKRCLCKDGSSRWTLNSVDVLSDSEGRPASALVVSTDITGRKLAEEARRSSEERLGLIVENAVDFAIFSTDLARRITTWNSGAQHLLGYSESEAVGMLVDALFTPEDRAAGAPEQETRGALQEGRANDDRLHLRKDGGTFWASGVMMPMRDGSGQVMGFVKILRDQSSVRASQQALESSRAELEAALGQKDAAAVALQAADAAKDRFLAVLSHELRNPLAAIQGASTVLQVDDISQQRRIAAAKIVARQTQMMKGLLEDILDVSRLRLGRFELRRSHTPLAAILRNAVEVVRPVLEADGHELAVTMPEDDVRLDADPVRMSQVISNLLSNAVKYTPKGGHIELRAAMEGDHAVVSVCDDGIGMDPAVIDSMFAMFTQGPPREGSGTLGLGIGLALVRDVVEQHGGTVQGASDGPGKGSCFTVRLPVLPAHAAASPSVASASSAHKLEGRPCRILLADDNEDLGWTYANLLSPSASEVHFARSGSEALEWATQEHPEVAVLDIGMPDIDGKEVARRLRAEPWGARMLLVAITGWGQQTDRDDILQAGFDFHLVKPVDMVQLRRIIENWTPPPAS